MGEEVEKKEREREDGRLRFGVSEVLTAGEACEAVFWPTPKVVLSRHRFVLHNAVQH